MRLCVPAQRELSAGPGTAKTGMPCSAAWVAVCKVPLFRAASITTTARLIPEMIRFRAGKRPACGAQPISASAKRDP